MRRIVSNTGPLLHLEQAQALDLLRLAGEVFIPKAVDMELAYLDPSWRGRHPPWIMIEVLVEPFIAEAIAWQQAGLLDPGEAETLSLARQLQADWLLTDDAAARLVAQTQGLEVHGSLGMVLWAAAVGHLDQAESEAALNRLAESSLWISGKVLAEARATLEEMFS